MFFVIFGGRFFNNINVGLCPSLKCWPTLYLSLTSLFYNILNLLAVPVLNTILHTTCEECEVCMELTDTLTTPTMTKKVKLIEENALLAESLR